MHAEGSPACICEFKAPECVREPEPMGSPSPVWDSMSPHLGRFIFPALRLHPPARALSQKREFPRIFLFILNFDFARQNTQNRGVQCRLRCCGCRFQRRVDAAAWGSSRIYACTSRAANSMRCAPLGRWLPQKTHKEGCSLRHGLQHPQPQPLFSAAATASEQRSRRAAAVHPTLGAGPPGRA